MQDLMAANPQTRPVLIEGILTQVKSTFFNLSSLFETDNSNVLRIAQLEEELEYVQQELELKQHGFDQQIQALTDQLESVRETVAMEFEFKMKEEASSLEKTYKESESKFESEIAILKGLITEREIDQTRFTEMVKCATEQGDIRTEIQDLKETLNKQLALKDTELDELRAAISGFHRALEESRMRELKYAM